MFDFLESYLEATVTPEQKRTFMDACNTLTEHGFQDHELAIAQALSVQDDLDGNEAIALLTDYLLPVYKEQLGAFGIVFNENIDVRIATDILKALMLVENWDDKATLNALTDNGDGPEASLADILEILGSFTSADYLNTFDRVNPQLPERIEEQTTVEISDAPTDPEELEIRRSRLLKFLSLLSDEQRQNLFLTAALNNGARLCYPVHTYLDLYIDRFTETLPVQDWVINLLAFLFASDSHNAHIKSHLKDLFDDLHLDYRQTTQMDALANDYLKRVFTDA